MKRTKILATIGPASDNPVRLRDMIRAGMDAARINTAHGDFPQYLDIIRKIRAIADIPILIDIKGPEIRIRTKEPIDAKRREIVPIGCTKASLPHFSYDLYDEIDEDDLIYFDNGQIRAKVAKKIPGKKLAVEFLEDGVIRPNKGVNVPNKALRIPSLSAKDRESIRFAIRHHLSFVALSFVRDREDVLQLRRLLGRSGIAIISKIENWQGVANIDGIIEESDGIMVARGDLGVEIEQERIPIIQKRIVEKCNRAGKIAIVATQMLETMIENAIPTRAEVSDVANAVLDGADTVMLSGETASGRHPVRAVETMHRIAAEAEKEVENKVDLGYPGGISEEMSKSAYRLAQRTGATKAVCITRSGFSARLVSRFRLTKPIIAVTDNPAVERQLKMVWGVEPVLIRKLPDRTVIRTITVELVKRRMLAKSDLVVYFGGVGTLQHQVSNLIEFHMVKDVLAYRAKHI